MPNTQTEKATQLLTDLGLTAYESKSYIALLKTQPATAYEISKSAGIPSSKIYEVISRLSEKGLAKCISEKAARGKQYVALDAKDYLEGKREETIQKTEELGPLLDSVKSPVSTDPIWQLEGDQEAIQKAKKIIQSAKDELLLSLWPKELKIFEAELSAAEHRGVKIAMVHFGIPQTQIGATYTHPVEKTIYQEKGGRALTLVADRTVVLISTFFEQGQADTVWSRNHSFVTSTEDYIKHDVYITKVTARLDNELKAAFGTSYEKLRDIFTP